MSALYSTAQCLVIKVWSFGSNNPVALKASLAGLTYQVLYFSVIPFAFRLRQHRLGEGMSDYKRRQTYRLVCNLVHSTLIGLFGIIFQLQDYRTSRDEPRQRLFGYDEVTANACAIAFGYFVWHFLDIFSAWDDYTNWMRVHAVATGVCCGLNLKLLHHHARLLMLIELSTSAKIIRYLLRRVRASQAVQALATRMTLGLWVATRLCLMPCLIFQMAGDLSAVCGIRALQHLHGALLARLLFDYGVTEGRTDQAVETTLAEIAATVVVILCCISVMVGSWKGFWVLYKSSASFHTKIS